MAEEKEEAVEEVATYSAPSGDVPTGLDVEEAWREICKDKNAINWYLCGVDKKQNLTFHKAGNGGLQELSEELKCLFVCLRCVLCKDSLFCDY